ncbi:MAG: carboxypeptidase regulatory-like domain-containing protein, partial [Bdellovibrio bacteriovorus]
MSLRLIRERWPVLLIVIAALAFAVPSAFAAKGGVPGKPGDPAPTSPNVKGPSVTVSGTVTNSLSGQGIAGANVSFAALNATFSAVTNSTGAYSVRVAANASYDVTFAATNFTTETLTGSIVRNKDTTLSEDLVPVTRVIVNATATGTASPGATLSLSGTCTPMDGSTVIGTEWTQTEGTTAVIGDFMAASTSLELAPLGAYKDELIHLLKQPPITEAELPPNVPPPPSGFVGGLQDRTQVVAVVPYTLDRTAHVGLEFACETTSGVYTAAVNLTTALPWPVTTGLHTVPNKVPALLYAQEAASYDWKIVSQPGGSTATLADRTTQTPWFAPDVTGKYEITETISGKTLTLYSGLWRGVIDPVATAASPDGLPVADDSCMACHDDGFAPDAFTPWRETGHAHAFSDGLNTNDHFSKNCFSCHAVGVNAAAKNGGFDDTPSYSAFVNSGMLNNPDPLNWLDMLMGYPDTARLANIQCESCHGPQNHTGNDSEDYSDAHGGAPGAPRVSVASEVCATCHGEPARHGRYQQWQLSRHSNYELAVEEGTNPNCSRCHSGNGFVAWSKVGFDKDTTVTVTWDEDTVHPQTCATCHGPHETGTTSGSDPNAGVRIDGDSPELIAGYQAIGIGKGALCITCHNTRRGLRNDDVFDGLSDADKTRTPHGPTQGDLMMGMNAYFVEVGVRGKHSLIEDTCVTCHMEKTP